MSTHKTVLIRVDAHRLFARALAHSRGCSTGRSTMSCVFAGVSCWTCRYRWRNVVIGPWRC